MANKVKAEGGINMAQGIPAFQPPEPLLRKLQEIVFQPIHQYAPGTGNKLLTNQIVNRYHKYGLNQQNLLITNGGTEALSLLFTYFSKKIKVPFSTLAFDPVYESYKNLPRIFNRPFVAFPFNQNAEIDFSALEKTILEHEVKVIFISSPGNPLGKVWHQNEVENIVALAKKHGIYLVFDSVYCDLYFNQPPYSPLKHFSEQVFYVNAFSKKLSITGWRIGYLFAHHAHMSEIMDIHDYTGLSTPSILQQAVGEYLSEHNFGDDYSDKLREQLQKNYQQLSKELTQLGFKVITAEGGYFIWATLPCKYTNGFNFALDLYETEKVAVVPGEHFSNQAKNIIRFNIAINNDEIKAAIKRIKRFTGN